MRFWAVNLLVVFVMTGLVFNVHAAPDAAMRIVSVNGALTEIIYELGAEDLLVGVDTTSGFPSAAKSLPQVGYQRNLSVEGILSLSPTHLIASADAGPPEVLKQLESTGVQIISFEKSYTIESVLTRIAVVSNLIGKAERGRMLSNKIEERLSTLPGYQPGVARTFSENRNPAARPVLFFLGVGNGSPMVAGSNTAAHAMIKMAGGRNVFDSIEGYKSVSAEAIINAAPATILIVSHGQVDTARTVEKVLNTPGVNLTPAGKNRQIEVLDGLRFLGFGPRIANAIHDLSNVLDADHLEQAVSTKASAR